MDSDDLPGGRLGDVVWYWPVLTDFPENLMAADNEELPRSREFTDEDMRVLSAQRQAVIKLLTEGRDLMLEKEKRGNDMLTQPAEAPATMQRQSAGSAREIKDDFSVLLQGNRIKINATVDLEGIARLKQMLDHYEQILNLIG